jgi:hypothetical protein
MNNSKVEAQTAEFVASVMQGSGPVPQGLLTVKSPWEHTNLIAFGLSVSACLGPYGPVKHG